MTEYWEFYAPFAHIPGRYELARIHTTTHGSFDTWIVIETTTDRPVTVYVNSEKGERFMADRYPESTAIRVDTADLTIESDPWNLLVVGELRAPDGPVRSGRLSFSRQEDSAASATPYGGKNFPVWGSRYTCSGVDMEVTATVRGSIVGPEGTESVDGTPGIITLGSFGRITPGSGD
jgi:hypothetical protein